MGLVSDVAKELVPPGGNASDDQHNRWRWLMFGAVLSVAAAVTLSFWQIDALADELAGVKESIVCSNLKGQIERNRADLYAIEREIEQTNGNVTERVRMRRAELTATVADNERRFVALGCLNYLA